MASKASAAVKVVKVGVRYAPGAYRAVRAAREPAQAMAQRAYTRLSVRRQALAHAATLLDGSVWKGFAGDQPVWVVFSGDHPVATHPATEAPLETLLRHADLSTRIRPQDAGRGRRRAAQPRHGAETPRTNDADVSIAVEDD